MANTRHPYCSYLRASARHCQASYAPPKTSTALCSAPTPARSVDSQTNEDDDARFFSVFFGSPSPPETPSPNDAFPTSTAPSTAPPVTPVTSSSAA